MRDQPSPAENGRVQALKYTLCLESDGFVPSHRLTRRRTPWTQAVTKPIPKGTAVNEIIEFAFAQYVRLVDLPEQASYDDSKKGEA